MSKFTRAVIVLFLALVGIWLATCEQSPDRWPRQTFSADQWKLLPPEKRYVMVRDLIDSGRLHGQRKEVVVALLGQPSYEAPDGSYVTYVVKNVPPNVKS